MTKKRIVEGICSICGIHNRLSFEHVPPKSAFNSNPILVQSFENLFDHNSYLYKKNSRSNRGFGRYTLCEKCNNNTGEWYAKDYAEFASQAMTEIKNIDGPLGEINIRFKIKPLNVIKQVLVMLCSANHGGGVLSGDPEISDFLLNKERRIKLEKYKVYMYYNLSKNMRMNGNVTKRKANGEIVNWSEINFKPFGFLLTFNSSPPNEYMADISDFSLQEYDKSFYLDINAAYLKISSFETGVYDNI